MKRPVTVCEISWELCHHFGKIYQQLEKKTGAFTALYGENALFIGPDFPHSPQQLASFEEPANRSHFENDLAHSLIKFENSTGISIRLGRWKTAEGEPVCLLLQYPSLFDRYTDLTSNYWQTYALHSLWGGDDFNHPFLFGVAAARLVHFLFHSHYNQQELLAHAHDWTSASALLELREIAPELATCFTLHHCTLGNSLNALNRRMGDWNLARTEDPVLATLAEELHISAKHSIETIAARLCDDLSVSTVEIANDARDLLSRYPNRVHHIDNNEKKNNGVQEILQHHASALFFRDQRLKLLSIHSPKPRNNDHIQLRSVQVTQKLPEALQPLFEIAYQLAWDWSPEARKLFSDIDPKLWQKVRENPIQFIEQISSQRMHELTHDADYLSRLKQVHENFRSIAKTENKQEIAYFSAEYGISPCLRFYSGGLGILAGDLVKSASDLNLSFVAVGLAYHQGYFEQEISNEGRQKHHYPRSDFGRLPMQLVCDEKGSPIVAKVPLADRNISVRAWKIKVGKVSLLLLDTDFSENKAEDRGITSTLYGGDTHLRLQQELILGIGGVLFLDAAHIQAKVFHMNEGHSAFLVLARIYLLCKNHALNFQEALEYCRATSLFTTHTPVPAGHDHFHAAPLEHALRPFCELLNVNWNQLHDLGFASRPSESSPLEDEIQNQMIADPSPHLGDFSMTHLALNGARFVNGVSEIHGEISRKMFKNFYSGLLTSEIPVKHVTNGVHAKSWLAKAWHAVLSKYVHPHWDSLPATAIEWRSLHAAPDSVIWHTHCDSKKELLKLLAERGLRNFATDEEMPLVIGFARRFAPYKRATLLFQDLPRLQRLLSKQDRAVLFIFAGKAHPRDHHGQDLIQQVIHVSKMPEFQEKIIFIENYDITIARHLVAGCDVWMNTPIRPLEASGTSGMKAAMNGTLNLSVADGWWAEGANGKNGWLIGPAILEENLIPEHEQTQNDNREIITLLESKVVPLYYDLRTHGVPSAWVSLMKESIASLLPQFSSHRMVQDYNQLFYTQALKNADELAAHDFIQTKKQAELFSKYKKNWPKIAVIHVHLQHAATAQVGESRAITIELAHQGLLPSELQVEWVVTKEGTHHQAEPLPSIISLTATKELAPGLSRYEGLLHYTETGEYQWGIRVRPAHAEHWPHMRWSFWL